MIRATTMFERLHERYSGQSAPGQLRILQRHLRHWRAFHNPDRDVFFEQEYPPGRQAAVEFTHASSLGATFVGKLLELLTALEIFVNENSLDTKAQVA